ncbi:MAG: hypothetical protein JWR52_3906 [Marmoricola sp.]|nr:hypothetical protein [Marmoricola sp.]
MTFIVELAECRYGANRRENSEQVTDDRDDVGLEPIEVRNSKTPVPAVAGNIK